MKLEEALRKLKNGEKIRKKRWIKDYYIYLEDGIIKNNYQNSDTIVIDEEEDLTEDIWDVYVSKDYIMKLNGKKFEIMCECTLMNNCHECSNRHKYMHDFCMEKVYGNFDTPTAFDKLSDDSINEVYNSLYNKGE